MQTPCNGNNSNKDIRIMADGFIYKKKHISLCHGFQNYFIITLKMKYCLGEFYDYFEGLMTALDESWVLNISQNMEHIMSHVQTSYISYTKCAKLFAKIFKFMLQSLFDKFILWFVPWPQQKQQKGIASQRVVFLAKRDRTFHF